VMSGIVPTTNIVKANITLEIGVGLQVPNSKNLYYHSQKR
jgi:hypothetical protein